MNLNGRTQEPQASGRLRICLAASGGGHVRQILDLEDLWSEHDSFFVTEDTALGRSIAQTQETYFVPHVALGQAKSGKSLSMLRGAADSFNVSRKIVQKTRPDVILTTGAGSMSFLVIWGRLMGAKIILIDSFARFEKPSKFAKLMGPLAHLRVAQADAVAKHWKNAVVFDPFRTLENERPAKEPLLFATVGATLAFPRLIDMVLSATKAGSVEEKVIMQVGSDGMADRETDVEWSETYSFGEMKDLMHRAEFVVCHGGTGSLITALQSGCRVIAVPRRRELGEHYDDHQSEITETFRHRGLIEIADNENEFVEAMATLRQREPVPATTDYSKMIEYLKTWIAGNVTA